jgi:LPS O-antigen subunit length determinant protein (WzzB/FepE family)
MVQYTLPQNPEFNISVPGKDSPKARDKAMEQFIELMEAGEIPAELADGVGPQQFIEIKEPGLLVVGSEDALNQAVQILSGLATLKLKAQETREEAMKIRRQIDVLFTDDLVSEEEIVQLKDGFKILKTYAQSNMRYREARAQAEMAREVLDEALKSADPESSIDPTVAPDLEESEAETAEVAPKNSTRSKKR